MKHKWTALLDLSRHITVSAFIGVVVTIGLFSLTGCGGGGSAPRGSTVQNTPTQNASAPSVTTVTAATDSNVASPQMIGNDQRMAVVYECWYALRKADKSPGSGPIGPYPIWSGYTVSNWDYLDDDPNAFSYVRSLPSPGPLCSTSNFRYSQTAYGHAGQCTFFVTLILKRSRNITLMNGKGWIYPSGCPAVKSSLDPKGVTPLPGDIIFYNQSSTSSHVAIVVNSPSSDGKGIEVVDSNVAGYGKNPWQLNTGFDPASSEIISRHTIPWSEIHNNQYKVYSGKGIWY